MAGGVAEEAVEFLSPMEIAIGIDAIGAFVSVVVAFFVVGRVAPVLSFRWQKRALNLLLVAVVCFFVARILSLIERPLSLGPLEPLVEMTHVTVAVLLVLCVGFTGYSLRRSEKDEISSLRRSADTDYLTSLPNQAYFRRAAERRFALSRENGIPLSCVVLDIDDFKPYNDEFGHEVGYWLSSA